MRSTPAGQPARCSCSRPTRVLTLCQSTPVPQERTQIHNPAMGSGPKQRTTVPVRIRSTVGPREYWQIADVHCSTFYEASEESLLGQLLRVDRVMALNTGT